MGARADGTKEVIAVEDGYRESAESWARVLRGLKKRGMRAPVLGNGDGALGFWAAVRDVFPETREQRCWVHRLVNVLDKLPKGLRPKAKRALHEIMKAETKEQAPHFLRSPGGALGASADDKSHRVAFCHGPASSESDERSWLTNEGARDGLQAAPHGAATLAPTQCIRATAAGPGGIEISRRASSGAGGYEEKEERRLISLDIPQMSRRTPNEE
jgi:hypothetical protein